VAGKQDRNPRVVHLKRWYVRSANDAYG
jgi:hypothetical protein